MYKQLGLQLQTRKQKKRASHARVQLGLPKKINERWSMDFVADRLDNGRRFRILAVMDLFTRECLLMEAEFSFNAEKVVSCIDRLRQQGKLPEAITVDNGTEFASKKVDAWAYAYRVQLDFIRPGRPIDNAFIESFNGRLRDECLNAKVFVSIENAKQELEAWRIEYNTRRTHSAIGDITPNEYAQRFSNLAVDSAFSNLRVA